MRTQAPYMKDHGPGDGKHYLGSIELYNMRKEMQMFGGRSV
jgi:hypothetical protein